MRKFPAKNGWQDALQKLREENAGLKKQIATLTEKLLEKERNIIEQADWGKCREEYQQKITALTVENERLKEQLISRREYRFVDVTPNREFPVRILSAYLEDGFNTDNTLGILPQNPLYKLMNEAQEKRNGILRKAIEALRGEEDG